MKRQRPVASPFGSERRCGCCICLGIESPTYSCKAASWQVGEPRWVAKAEHRERVAQAVQEGFEAHMNKDEQVLTLCEELVGKEVTTEATKGVEVTFKVISANRRTVVLQYDLVAVRVDDVSY